jgi:hypothetical protein
VTLAVERRKPPRRVRRKRPKRLGAPVPAVHLRWLIPATVKCRAARRKRLLLVADSSCEKLVAQLVNPGVANYQMPIGPIKLATPARETQERIACRVHRNSYFVFMAGCLWHWNNRMTSDPVELPGLFCRRQWQLICGSSAQMTQVRNNPVSDLRFGGESSEAPLAASKTDAFCGRWELSASVRCRTYGNAATLQSATSTGRL